VSQQIILTGVLIDEETVFTIEEICQRFDIDRELIHAMIEYGLIQADLDLYAIQRIQSALRLQRDLEINLPGIALAFELMDELEQLKTELAILRKHIE
jgi:chaperone modulatory protein CbpM